MYGCCCCRPDHAGGVAGNGTPAAVAVEGGVQVAQQHIDPDHDPALATASMAWYLGALLLLALVRRRREDG